ncbi:MAG: PDZ domain-containing protein [Planctomycetota bacterium]
MSSRPHHDPRPPGRSAEAPRARTLLWILPLAILLPAASRASHESELYLVKTPRPSSWLGIRFRPTRGIDLPFRPAQDLPMVTDVLSSTPAREAGLAPGDVILSLNAQAVAFDDLAPRILGIAPGTAVEIEVSRRGAVLTVRATLADRSTVASAPSEQGRPPLGMKLLPAQGVDRGLRGLWIESVLPLSPADRAGLRAGMVLLCAQDRPVRQPDDLTGVLKAPQPLSFVTLGIRQGRRIRFVVLPTE